MYTTSQVHATELFELDNYLSQWEKNLKFGKDVLCGVAGMFGGAGHLLDASKSFLKMLKKPIIEKGIDLAIAFGGAFEAGEKGLELIHQTYHYVKGHASHHNKASKKPGGWVKTSTQLENLNGLFSGCQEFNSKHSRLLAQLAFCYQEQLDLIDEHYLGIFARACGDHWLEALMMGYIQKNLSEEELLEKGMAWMAYVKMNNSTNAKIRLKSGQYVQADDLLKKPRIKAHYQVPIDHQSKIDFPAKGLLKYELVVHSDEQVLCESLKGRMITQPVFDNRFGYRHASQVEVKSSRQPSISTPLIVWDNVMTLNATRSERSNTEEAVFQYIHYTPCPYSSKVADVYYLTFLENRLAFLEKSEKRINQQQGALNNKIDC